MSQIASESQHWYDRKGSPCYQIQGKNGNMRSATLRDARTLDLVPSVTKIVKDVLRAPGLETWILRQTLEAALTLPKLETETVDQFAERVIEDSREKSMKAAERGTALHTSIENYLKGEIAPEWKQHLEILDKTLEQHDIDMHAGNSEHSFCCSLGYGGKIDHHTKTPKMVLDFKSKDVIKPKDKLIYDEHAMQIAAYGYGLFSSLAFRGLNVFIGVEDPTVVVLEHSPEDLQRGFEMFRSCLKLWRLKYRFGSDTSNRTSLFF